MDRHRNISAPRVHPAAVGDPHGAEALILSALGTDPVDAESLQRGVWAYVCAARHTGMAPGRTIMALTLLVETAGIAPASARQALTRQMIQWCVEAHLGVNGQDSTAAEDGWQIGVSTPA